MFIGDGDLMKIAFAIAPVGLCLSHSRVIAWHNDKFAQMFDYTSESLVGKSFSILYPSAHEYESIGERGQQIMSKTGEYCDDRIMKNKKGKLFWCHVAGKSLEKDNPFACAVWMFEDISARRPLTTQLTERERQIACLLVTGNSSKEIARQLNISHRTVEAHRAHMISKLGATGASDLIARLMGAV